MAATILTHAFFEDPVYVWTFPDEDRRRDLDPFHEAFARPYVRHGETYVTEDATGAALWLPPGAELVSAEEEAEFVHELGETAGQDAGRLFALLELFDQNHPEGTYRVLQLLAVEPEYQSRGIGSALLAPGLARSDQEQVPTYLEATSERSIPFYERHGFHGDRRDRAPRRPVALPDVAGALEPLRSGTPGSRRSRFTAGPWLRNLTSREASHVASAPLPTRARRRGWQLRSMTASSTGASS